MLRSMRRVRFDTVVNKQSNLSLTGAAACDYMFFVLPRIYCRWLTSASPDAINCMTMARERVYQRSHRRVISTIAHNSIAFRDSPQHPEHSVLAVYSQLA